MNYLQYLEKILDNDNTVCKFNNSNTFSLIQANFLFINQFYNTIIYIFISEDDIGNYFCRSFFPKSKVDYEKEQTKWTILKKIKTNRDTNITEVLYERDIK